MDSREHVKWMQVFSSAAVMIVLGLATAKNPAIVPKERCRTSVLTGRMYVQELLNGHARRFQEIMRMQLTTFLAICQDLREVEIKETLNISVEEQLAMFLSVVGHRWSNRDVQERFQHSGETVHR
jgi:hypothetical protein